MKLKDRLELCSTPSSLYYTGIILGRNQKVDAEAVLEVEPVLLCELELLNASATAAACFATKSARSRSY